MDNLFKQMRVKFSGIEEGNVGETSRVRDRRMSSQKTRSFNRDNRRGRQSSSRELRYDDDSDYMESDEFRTAVAAAAFAINSAEEQRKRTRRRRDDHSLKNKAKKKQEDGQVSIRPRERIQLPSSSSSSHKMKNKEDDSVPISTPTPLPKKPSELQEKVPKGASRSPGNTGESPRQSLVGSRFVIKKTPPPTPTPFDKQPDKTITSTKSESGFTSGSHQQPPPPQTNVDKKRSQSRLEDTKADVWEKTEMERINERYDKLNAKILEWENEKQAKAKKKLSRKKDGSESKRARALQTYKTDMEMIDQIAEGARSQAEENRRKDIKKVKEKADKIRLTGKIPTKTCLCL